MRRSLITGLAIGLWSCFAVSGLSAQTSANANASISISTVLSIDVTNTSVTFPEPTASDFETGYVAENSGASDVSTSGNVVHDVEISADASNFTGGDGTKPASDLRWSTDGFSSQDVGLSTTPADVVTGLDPGEHDNVVTVDYRVLLDYATDAPADYSLDFTYTVVAN